MLQSRRYDSITLYSQEKKSAVLNSDANAIPLATLLSKLQKFKEGFFFYKKKTLL